MDCKGPCLPYCTSRLWTGIMLLLFICIVVIILLILEYNKNNKNYNRIHNNT